MMRGAGAAAAASLVTCAAQLLCVIKLTTKCVKTPVVFARGCCCIVSVHSAKESFERLLRYRYSREYLLFENFLCSYSSVRASINARRDNKSIYRAGVCGASLWVRGRLVPSSAIAVRDELEREECLIASERPQGGHKSQSRHLTRKLNLSLLQLLPQQFLSLRQEPKPRSKGLNRVNRVHADRPVCPSLRRFWTKNQYIYVLRSESRGSRARSTMIELLMPCMELGAS
ncbi:unnamed protein product [Trichogramma brassicae]|uniref:Secreted protein n=1 Tax=Trichogramma brassicae TaxID=86971 RepID=A0A6H5IA22_9HYME|nr:unnamed protein product [Trichogramma brassicae]